MDPRKAPGRILVADDDPSIRQLVSTIVRREHFEVDTAADGQEAVALLDQHDYSVILVDLMMPRVDGFGVIAHIKEHPTRPKPIVLVITAYADQKFKQVDADIVAGVIRKPFEVAELGSLVRLCMNGLDSELQRALPTSEEALRNYDASGAPEN